jgi:hypothetical protein
VIEAWQFSLSGNSGTRSEKKSLFCGVQKKQNAGRVQYWEIIADNLKKAGWSWVASQPWILRDEQSGLLTRIATTEGVSLCRRMIS